MSDHPPWRARARHILPQLAVLCFGCAAEEVAHPGLNEVTNETALALLAGPFGEPMCAGDEVFVDRQLERLQSELGAPLEGKVAVNIHAVYPVPGCDSGGTGCFKDGLINTRWEALPHEFVHAVAVHLANPADFWAEGLAEALSGARTERGEDRVLDIVDADNLDFSYRTAGHFVRWIIESRGIERFTHFYGGDVFDAVYGATLAEIEQEFETDAPWSYPPLESCDLPVLGQVAGGYDDTIEIDCGEDPWTMRFDGSVPNVSAQRSFEVDEEADFALTVSGGMGVYIFKCQTAVLFEQTDDRMAGDVYSELKTLPPTLLWESGERHVLRLEAGKHRMTIVAREGREADSVRVELSRAE